IFMVGWAIGGVIFGILGGRVGRAQTMLFAIVIYSAFTRLRALSRGGLGFPFFRFPPGPGVGGAVGGGGGLGGGGVPGRARAFCLGWPQALSALGNMAAALIVLGFGQLQQSGAIGSAWRAMFVVGVLPALLVLPIFRRLKEPERWKQAASRSDGLA